MAGCGSTVEVSNGTSPIKPAPHGRAGAPTGSLWGLGVRAGAERI